MSETRLRMPPRFWGVVVLCLGAGLSACGASHRSDVEKKTAHAVVKTEPISSAGDGRFTLPVGTDLPGLGLVTGVLRAPSGRSSSYRGDHPGLYAARRGAPGCDLGKLSALLAQNPSEAAVWASTLGVRSAHIHSYLAGLTPVYLRTDTRVTNHGFVNGDVTSAQSVLQAGTAIAVDKYGQPVTKCYCGNPLTAPVMSLKSIYSGPQWSGFSPARVSVIQRATRIIRTFTLYDPASKKMFQRHPGTYIVASEVTYSGAPASSTTTQTASSTPPEQPTTSSQQASPATSATTSSQDTQATTTPADGTQATTTPADGTQSTTTPADGTQSSTTTSP